MEKDGGFQEDRKRACQGMLFCFKIVLTCQLLIKNEIEINKQAKNMNRPFSQIKCKWPNRVMKKHSGLVTNQGNAN